MESRSVSSSLVRFAALAASCGTIGCCLDPGAAGSGTSTGRENPDAGTCSIDSQVFETGTWLGFAYGSCVSCTPTLNADRWTFLDAGASCEAMAQADPSSLTFTIPVVGRCSVTNGSPNLCVTATAGGACNEQIGCAGGHCGDAGFCEVDQNLGWFDSCVGLGVDVNPCEEGPCCIDAGYNGIRDGGGWCCGLIDGGERTCLIANQVCFTGADCCPGLGCVGSSGISPGIEPGPTYGLCVPN